GLHGTAGKQEARRFEREATRDPKHRGRGLGQQYACDGLPGTRPGPRQYPLYRPRDQPSRIQALETGRAQASWMGSTFSAPLKKKGYTVLLEMARAPIVYLGASLVVRRSAVRQDPKPYEAMLKGTLDAIRFFMKPENKSASMKSIARVLRLQR